ncbi:MAG: type II toxin-antitoxin system RelE/ParE family toxin [Planctomycetaceae bacterium]|nr:type II toxin-antitoxin system RelE/ParE family toxin [Planctomycetaceae bacterium]
MMTPYRVAPLAQFDLDEIWAYVAKDRPVAADRLMEAFHQKFLALSSQPLMGESRDDLAPGLRSFSCGNYLLLYRLTKRRIEIVRVIHAARDINAIF